MFIGYSISIPDEVESFYYRKDCKCFKLCNHKASICCNKIEFKIIKKNFKNNDNQKIYSVKIINTKGSLVNDTNFFLKKYKKVFSNIVFRNFDNLEEFINKIIIKNINEETNVKWNILNIKNLPRF